MKIFTIFTIIIVNFIIQSTILPYFSIFGVVPNTALIIVVIIALSKGKYYGGFFGLFIGLIQDVIFNITLGINGFIYFFAGYLIGSIEKILARDNVLSPIIFTSLTTIYYNIFYFLFMFFLSRYIPFKYYINHVIPIELVYNGLVSILIYKLFNRVYKVPSLKFGRKSR